MSYNCPKKRRYTQKGTEADRGKDEEEQINALFIGTVGMKPSIKLDKNSNKKKTETMFEQSDSSEYSFVSHEKKTAIESSTTKRKREIEEEKVGSKQKLR